MSYSTASINVSASPSARVTVRHEMKQDVCIVSVSVSPHLFMLNPRGSAYYFFLSWQYIKYLLL